MLGVSSELLLGIYSDLKERVIGLSQELLRPRCILLIEARFLFAGSSTFHRISDPDLLRSVVLRGLNLGSIVESI